MDVPCLQGGSSSDMWAHLAAGSQEPPFAAPTGEDQSVSSFTHSFVLPTVQAARNLRWTCCAFWSSRRPGKGCCLPRAATMSLQACSAQNRFNLHPRCDWNMLFYHAARWSRTGHGGTYARYPCHTCHWSNRICASQKGWKLGEGPFPPWPGRLGCTGHVSACAT